VKLPRDVDVRSLAAVLFGFVVVIVFGGIAAVAIACRIFGTSCIADSAGALETVRGLTENIIAILLALMAGTAGRPPKEPP
jgi:hypothetical protein